MDLDPHVFGPGHFEETERLLVEAQHGMGGVLHDHNIVRLGKGDDLLEKLTCCRLSGRTVGIVDDQQLRAATNVFRNSIQIRIEIILGKQRKPVHLPAVVPGMGPCYRIARHRHQCHVARIDESGRQNSQRRFRANAVVDFSHRIEFDPKLSFHESSGGFFEFRDPIVGIAPVLRFVDLRSHYATNALGRHLIVLADSKVKQRSVGMIRECLALRAFDLLEFVDFRIFAVVFATDTLGEHLLEIGVAHYMKNRLGEAW